MQKLLPDSLDVPLLADGQYLIDQTEDKEEREQKRSSQSVNHALEEWRESDISLNPYNLTLQNVERIGYDNTWSQ